MPYTINNTIYATKKDIISQAQSILNKTKDHQEVSISDYNFLIELFKNHDEWEEKSKNECIGITAGITTRHQMFLFENKNWIRGHFFSLRY